MLSVFKLAQSQPNTHRTLTTSAVNLVSKRKQSSRLKKKVNISRKQSVVDAQHSNLPSPALGYRSGEEDIWNNSQLAQIVLTPEQVYSNVNGVSGRAPLSHLTGVPDDPNDAFPGIEIPKLLNTPMRSEDLLSIFKTLPSLSAQRKTQSNSLLSDIDIETVVEHERIKLETFSRLIDLRNSSAKGIMLENIRRCITAFGDGHVNGNSTQPTHQGDSGKVEVQAAILTTRIRSLVTHLQLNPRDTQNKRSLSQLVHHRAKLLKYLKTLSDTRYQSVLPRLGLTPKAIEMEISGSLI
ncbi:hypothetical protein E3P92_01283 [Wallemia ichthyophaga]|uniref:30S ribosomal protein S15 n=2 Tax=Wallemia ichthyophaga TaxID=245174 RepID=A0A4T0HJA8_WALIC|nr:30S ribosomal protein S15 [Wallemia ichthyophaga EXF-994]TIA74398.1 hypothetical protein E3P91_00991 [Wallemia ichthyophaga]EOR00825.1 30S ribosomal protein S15 [Wallemia ichthyophaga EXF-994]TIA82964.1 hypothetical protein E3P98_01052 [Wallemia ichthyophaga]TIA96979.1 hypothetical protein E3P95_03026 [Wallemia ichthyophaga]TIA98245.1 hypothetical protein E3P94_03016 [Wallemia ichthyophaga]